ncbi:D-alanyl-D-alanine carboxypeptidase family protein [Novosphingobium cyanobacteriorum]|uniref:serine-type D-Ala-D-Ala carboxypeptidase n=1 Tax=Novosphingobium cyanobacteriorum TaxID=3024215 RepID=A0ABT6CHS7_9SPHN|nr:D-alanyl-D-alanine carboxypeptidase family protein [Novosphingobium cyanobacteriorum]MDF8331892.1 D-alanyl-D-alanine carboxypeptidase [Novosphingobium cyanobacteriorum]
MNRKFPAALLSFALAATPALAQAPGIAPADPAVLPEITAPIALMVDVNSGRVLFERQSHRRFVPASLTKIMTSYVAFELIAQGRLRLDQTFPMRAETFRKWHGVGSTMFLANNSQTSVADLLEGIVTVSANDACVVLAEGIAGSVPGFTAMMNAEARKLGMKDTHYNTPNGWMDEGQTYVSGADLATLSIALITRHPELYRRFYGHDRMTWNGIAQANHNPLYGHTAGADGVKTGFTNEAGYGLVGSAERNGRRLMMVVGGYDRPNDRAQQSRAFIEWGFAAWDSHPLYPAGAQVGTVEVQGGVDRSVALVTPHPAALLAPRGAGVKPQVSIRYKGPLKAPIAKGEAVATLLVRTPGQPDEQVPLLAAVDVPKGGLYSRLRNGLLRMLGR